MNFPAELGLSISTISDTKSLEGLVPAGDEYPSTESEISLFSLPINGSEANAGGGLRDSATGNETGWFPNRFFSIPVCTKNTQKPFDILII